MQRVEAARELDTLAECGYRFPAETLHDIQTLRSLYSDLRLYVDYYCFPNKEKKKLVYVAGTVPVQYEGSQYNIPVCLWLHVTYPASRPRCYVCPSVSMVINTSCSCVDEAGNVLVAGLKNWTKGVSNLSLLVSEMRRSFQKDTPLYARWPPQTPPPADRQAPPPADRQADRQAGDRQADRQAPTADSSSQPSAHKDSQWQQGRAVNSQWEQGRAVRNSYTEDLLGIDFSVPASANHHNPFISPAHPGGRSIDRLSETMDALRLEGERDEWGERETHTHTPSPHRETHTHTPSPVHRETHTHTPSPHRETHTHTPSPVHRERHTHSPTQRETHTPSPLQTHTERETHTHLDGSKAQDPAGLEHMKMASCLDPDQAAIFVSLVTMEGRSFSPSDVIEAVRLNRDLPSALKFLTHTCPICQEQLSFSKIVPMTHCSCFLCVSCFTSCFLSAIKEKSVDQLTCPQCGRPEVKGHGAAESQTAMEYFNLLDTQIRHYLPPEIHELFQRKLRDRALQQMNNFRWCSHCSFGMLHEADRLRMDCPSCKKSTCCQCRSPWSPQHESRSCSEFRLWQQQNRPDQNQQLGYSSIECPCCRSVFSLSRGGCLHFTCSQCQHQFCGGCSHTFTPGPQCGFSSSCGSKGLHAHHPRDCLYHLRDWSVARLHALLTYYRVSPSCLDRPRESSPGRGDAGVCSVPELRDERREEPCGRAADHRGYCQLHYKECLVGLVQRCRGDPAVLFSSTEMMSELQRWSVAVPTRRPDQSEAEYETRLRTVLVSSVPLSRSLSPVRRPDDLHPLSCGVTAAAPPPHLLL